MEQIGVATGLCSNNWRLKMERSHFCDNPEHFRSATYTQMTKTGVFLEFIVFLH